MTEHAYILYDTAQFGTTAATNHDLFKVAQGGDSTHTESFTNMRGPGYLPQQEAFQCLKIGVMADYDVAEDDVQAIWRGSYLEFRINEETFLKAPLSVFAEKNGYHGHFTQATAALEAIIGLEGDGYMLAIPLEIPGGTPFSVRVHQATAVAGANSNVKVLLHGVLTRP